MYLCPVYAPHLWYFVEPVITNIYEGLFFPQNIFVSYDTDHIEDDEDGVPNGRKWSQKTHSEPWKFEQFCV